MVHGVDPHTCMSTQALNSLNLNDELCHKVPDTELKSSNNLFQQQQHHEQFSPTSFQNYCWWTRVQQQNLSCTPHSSQVSDSLTN